VRRCCHSLLLQSSAWRSELVLVRSRPVYKHSVAGVGSCPWLPSSTQKASTPRSALPIPAPLFLMRSPYLFSNFFPTRGIVVLNFSPRNLTQVTSAMKPGQEFMIWFYFGKENNSSRRVILKIELEKNNLNSNLSRSAVTPVFPDVSGDFGHKCRQTPMTRWRCHKHLK